MPRKSATKAAPVSQISEAEVWNVLEFANAVYSRSQNGVFTPDLLNRRMSDITLNPSIADESKVTTALNNPKENQDELVGYSEYFELTNSMYKRAVRYLGTLLAFDLSYEPINVKDVADMNSEAYKRDLAKVAEFLRKFKYQEEFAKIMQQCIRAETVYTFFRDEDPMRYVLQEMPRKYCKITRKDPYGLVYDFNMLWFVQPSVDINLYPEVFKDYYNVTLSGKNAPQYLPSAQDPGAWAYYAQTSHEDGAWAFKFSPEIAANIPFLAASFPDVVLQPMIRQLQKNQYIIAASKLIVGEIPFLKDLKGTIQKDQLALNPDTLGKFLALFKQGASDLLKVGALPMQELEEIEFKGDNTVFESYNRNLAGSTGLNSSFLYSSDKKNAVEARLAMNVDENIVHHMYAQFEDFLDFNINRLTKKYKFAFKFEGFNVYTDRTERHGQTIKLAQMGFVDINRIAHIFGTDAFGLEKRLMMAKSSNLLDLLTILPNANTAFGEAGRPSKDDGELSEAGSQTRETEGNER